MVRVGRARPRSCARGRRRWFSSPVPFPAALRWLLLPLLSLLLFSTSRVTVFTFGESRSSVRAFAARRGDRGICPRALAQPADSPRQGSRLRRNPGLVVLGRRNHGLASSSSLPWPNRTSPRMGDPSAGDGEPRQRFVVARHLVRRPGLFSRKFLGCQVDLLYDVLGNARSSVESPRSSTPGSGRVRRPTLSGRPRRALQASSAGDFVVIALLVFRSSSSPRFRREALWQAWPSHCSRHRWSSFWAGFSGPATPVPFRCLAIFAVAAFFPWAGSFRRPRLVATSSLSSSFPPFQRRRDTSPFDSAMSRGSSRRRRLVECRAVHRGAYGAGRTYRLVAAHAERLPRGPASTLPPTRSTTSRPAGRLGARRCPRAPEHASRDPAPTRSSARRRSRSRRRLPFPGERLSSSRSDTPPFVDRPPRRRNGSVAPRRRRVPRARPAHLRGAEDRDSRGGHN